MWREEESEELDKERGGGEDLPEGRSEGRGEVPEEGGLSSVIG